MNLATRSAWTFLALPLLFACGEGVEIGEDTTATSALTAAQCSYFAEGDKVTICHKTGSTKKPYQILRTNIASCGGHSAHDGDYVALADPTCNGQGCFPEGAPWDGSVECCEGLAPVDGYCAVTTPPAGCMGLPAADVAQYRFDDAATTATDSSGNNNAGTFVNSASYGVDKPGTSGNVASLDLDGASYVSVPSSSSLEIPGSYSIAAWAAADDVATPVNILSKQSGLPTNYNVHVIENHPFFSLAFTGGSGAGVQSVSVGQGGCDGGGCYVYGDAGFVDAEHPVGTWREVMAVYDDTAKSLSLYVDCTLVAQATFVTTLHAFTSDGPLQIGMRDTVWGFKGNIDDVRIWSVPLVPVAPTP